MRNRAAMLWIGFWAWLAGGPAFASGFLVSKMGGDISGPTEPNGAATFWNPAAIGPIQGFSLFLDTNWIWRQATFTRTWDPDVDPGARSADPGPMENFAAVPMLAATFRSSRPELERLALGLGFYAPFGNRSDWPEWDLQAELQKPEDQQAAPAQAYHSLVGKLEALYVTPTLSWRLTEDVWLGLGFSWVRAEVVSRRLKDFSMGLFEPEQVATSGLASLDFSGTAWAWSVGVWARPTPWLRLALSFSSEVELELPGSVELTLPGYLVSLYGERVDTSARMGMRLPAAVRGGIHWDVTSWLVLRLTAEYMIWSAYDQVRVYDMHFRNQDGPVGGTLGETKEFVSARDYHNTIDVRFGFRMFPVSWWMLFAGVGVDESAIPQGTQSPDIFDALKLGIAGGTRVQIHPLLRAWFGIDSGPDDQIALTVGVNYIQYFKNQVTASELDPPLNGHYHSHVVLLNTNLELRFQ